MIFPQLPIWQTFPTKPEFKGVNIMEVRRLFLLEMNRYQHLMMPVWTVPASSDVSG